MGWFVQAIKPNGDELDVAIDLEILADFRCSSDGIRKIVKGATEDSLEDGELYFSNNLYILRCLTSRSFCSTLWTTDDILDVFNNADLDVRKYSGDDLISVLSIKSLLEISIKHGLWLKFNGGPKEGAFR